MDAVWGLFFHLKDAFPNAKPQAFPSRRVGGVVKAAGTRAGYAAIPRLPYSTNDVWRLERSILSWLFSLGVLRDFSAFRVAGFPLRVGTTMSGRSCAWCAVLAHHLFLFLLVFPLCCACDRILSASPPPPPPHLDWSCACSPVGCAP